MSLHRNVVVNDFLASDEKIFGELVVLGQCGKIAVLVGGIDPFEDGMVIAHALDDIFYEFLVLDKVAAAQMENSGLVPVDEVMDLLGEPVVIRYIDDEVGKDFNGLVTVQKGLDFPHPRRFVPKDHRDPQYGRFFLGQPHHHVLDLYFEPAKDTFGQGLIVFIGRVFAIGVKNVGGRDEV